MKRLARPRILDRLLTFDARDDVIRGAQALRSRLPGDERYGDVLTHDPRRPVPLVVRHLRAGAAPRPSALREVGWGVLQTWQALSEAQGRGRGTRELTILFTDLAGFSDWVLKAGDEAAVDLLRTVGATAEPVIGAHRGRVVKRLGDGLMASFLDPVQATLAAIEVAEALEGIEIAGHRPRLRAGLHHGRPRRVGNDLFGVDVNVAARVADAARPGEVLVSDVVARALEEDDVPVLLGRRRRLRAKGAPSDLGVYAVRPAAG
jgi:adenylate cyclase